MADLIGNARDDDASIDRCIDGQVRMRTRVTRVWSRHYVPELKHMAILAAYPSAADIGSSNQTNTTHAFMHRSRHVDVKWEWDHISGT